MDAFEVDAWAMQSLMSGIHTTVEKANCQALTLHTIKCSVYRKFFVDAFYQVVEVAHYSCLSDSFYHEWVLNFVKCFLCIGVIM